MRDRDFEEALNRYEELLTWDRATHNSLGVAITLNNMGLIFDRSLGKQEEAERSYSQALKIFKKLGNKKYIKSVENNMAAVGLNHITSNVNTAPTISGTPLTSVGVNTAYTFIPSDHDIDIGDTLTFNIKNKPAWASFDTTTGTLTGTPARNDAGTYEDIVISVSDGKKTAVLPAFELTITDVNEGEFSQ